VLHDRDQTGRLTEDAAPDRDTLLAEMSDSQLSVLFIARREEQERSGGNRTGFQNLQDRENHGDKRPFVVAGPTPVHGKAGGVYSNLTSLNDTAMIGTRWHKIPWEQKERYWPIRAAGFACTLIHRDVIATLMDDAKAGRAAWPFRAGWRNGRMLQSEDFSFFLRAYKRGFRAYADLDNPCSHVKHIALTPSRAIEDLVFHDPTAQPHPQAPRDLPEGWAVAEFVGSGLNKPRLVVPAGAEPAPPAAPAKE